MKKPTRIRHLVIVSIGLLFAGPAGAHPVPFKGSISVMTWNQPFFNETMVAYSFHRRFALATQYMRMDMRDGEMKAVIPQLNALVRRWNELDSQANVYFVGGGGTYEFDDRVKTAALGGLEADYETRKVYVSAKVTGLWPSIDENMYVQTYRAGVAPYEAEYDEVAAWLILDVQHINRRRREVTVTPVLRAFYKNVLGEIGASFTGDLMLNFMVHL